MKKTKPYFNDHQALYQGRQPPFYDSDKIPGIALLESSFSAIYDELLSNLSDEKIAAQAFEKWTLHKKKGWRQVELKIYGVEYPRRSRLFPKTMDVINKIEGASTVYFSLLAPGARIEPHVGDTDAFYRVHLGLKIPGALPECGIEVAGMQRPWRPGKCVVFNDIYCHSAWNNTDEERIVLIVDIMRPEFRSCAIHVNSAVRATLYYSRLYEIFFPLIELMPRLLIRLLHPTFRKLSYLTHASLSRFARKP
ncbi:MAG: hypothetical protein K0R03_98 [Moraxellaceae bacterium]|nr:hypothetical protein [Moraxellaceae bacterium]